MTAAARATTLSGIRYRDGIEASWTCSMRSAASSANRRQELQVRSDRFQSTVALVRALGGGWESALDSRPQ